MSQQREDAIQKLTAGSGEEGIAYVHYYLVQCTCVTFEAELLSA